MTEGKSGSSEAKLSSTSSNGRNLQDGDIVMLPPFVVTATRLPALGPAGSSNSHSAFQDGMWIDNRWEYSTSASNNADTGATARRTTPFGKALYTNTPGLGDCTAVAVRQGYLYAGANIGDQRATVAVSAGESADYPWTDGVMVTAKLMENVDKANASSGVAISRTLFDNRADMLNSIGDQPAMVTMVSDAGQSHSVVIIKDPSSGNYFVTNMGVNGYVTATAAQLSSKFEVPSSAGGSHTWYIPVHSGGSWAFTFGPRK